MGRRNIVFFLFICIVFTNCLSCIFSSIDNQAYSREKNSKVLSVLPIVVQSSSFSSPVYQLYVGKESPKNSTIVPTVTHSSPCPSCSFSPSLNSSATVVPSRTAIDSDMYDLVMFTTADSKKVKNLVKNSINMLSLYQKAFSFKGVLFTDSPSLIQYAQIRNQYRMPYFNSMMMRVFNTYNASFYGYLNSDILVNPRVFSLLPTISEKLSNGTFPPILELASRVRMVNPFLQPDDFSSISNFRKAMNKCPNCILRTPYSSDIFIFPNSFPFQEIPSVVIGRYYIDNVLLQMPKAMKGLLVDLTFYAPSYHQGFDGFKNHGFSKQKDEDKYYNGKYVKGRTAMFSSHAKYYYDSEGNLQRVIRQDYQKMTYLFLL